jgi:hypothetical protein
LEVRRRRNLRLGNLRRCWSFGRWRLDRTRCNQSLSRWSCRTSLRSHRLSGSGNRFGIWLIDRYGVYIYRAFHHPPADEHHGAGKGQRRRGQDQRARRAAY